MSPGLRKKLMIAGIVVIAGGAAALLTCRAVLYASYRHPSGSMYPTIDVDAYVHANRLDTTPVRGAAFVFRYPEHRDQLFTKRAIGLAGDVVATKGNRLLVNGWEVPQCPLGRHEWSPPPPDEKHTGTLAVEFLEAAAYLVFYDDAALASEDGSWTVKSGEYFVIGDNRRNSHDSRMWFGGAGGGVPLADTVARVRIDGPPVLPRGAESLRPALDACLAKRPPARP